MPDLIITASPAEADGYCTVSATVGGRPVGSHRGRLGDPAGVDKLVAQLLQEFPALDPEQLKAKLAALASTPEPQFDDGPEPRRWPNALSESAYHGITGSFVRSCEPYTEADPAALLVQLLAAVGNCIGSGPHVMVGADRHGTNLYVAVVGQTSSGRKGTSWNCVRRVLASANSAWADDRIVGGLSTGEGLIHVIRDPSPCPPSAKPGATADLGVEDKRLLVVEGELGRQLVAMARDGNTTSAVLRQAWDANDPLRIMTRTSACRASNPHVSLIGHITGDELHHRMSVVDLQNGFANRVLWVCSRRSRLLPDAPELPGTIIDRLGSQLATVIDVARTRRRLVRTDTAVELWREVYPSLTKDRPGLLGFVVARASAMVQRLALIYALLDDAAAIDEVHLTAALAVWDYCEASADYVFGGRLLNPLADRIQGLLRQAGPAGLTRTQISERLGRNEKRERIDQAIRGIHGLAVETETPGPNGGRPAKRYVLRTNE